MCCARGPTERISRRANAFDRAERELCQGLPPRYFVFHGVVAARLLFAHSEQKILQVVPLVDRNVTEDAKFVLTFSISTENARTIRNVQ